MNIEDALERLSNHNLNPTYIDLGGDKKTIFGHAVVETDKDGKLIKQLGDYGIRFVDNLWRVTIAHPTTILLQSESLKYATDAVCQFYRLRETARSDDMTTEEAVDLLQKEGLIVTTLYKEMETIWGNSQRKVPTAEGFLSDAFCIYRFIDAWLGVHICTAAASNPIRFSKALGDVVRAVIDHFQGQDDAIHSEE